MFSTKKDRMDQAEKMALVTRVSEQYFDQDIQIGGFWAL